MEAMLRWALAVAGHGFLFASQLCVLSDAAAQDVARPARDPTWTVIPLGDTVRGTLTSDDYQLQGWHQDYYTLDSSDARIIGRPLVIYLRSHEFDAHLVVNRHRKREIPSSGRRSTRDSTASLQNDNAYPGTTDARIDVAFPPTPNSFIHVIVTSHTPGHLGAYELIIVEPEHFVLTPPPRSGACRDSILILPPASPRTGLTLAQALDELGRIQERTVSKSEFETAAEFATRQRRFVAEQQRDADAILAADYTWTTSVGVGRYDAEQELFPVTFGGENLSLRVPRSEAPSVRENSGRASGTGRFWLEDDGTAYLLGDATITVGTRRYTATGTQTIRILRSRAFGGARSVAVSRDGRWIATGPAGLGSTATLWDVTTGEAIATLPLETQSAMRDVRVLFSPDCRLVATSTNGRFRAFSIPDGRTLFDLSSLVDVFAFSPDGRILATGIFNTYFGRTVKIGLWDARTGQLQRELSLTRDEAGLYALAFSPDGRYLAGGTGFSIAIWADTGQLPSRSLRGHSGTVTGFSPVTGLAFSPDGRTLASIDSRELNVWSFDSAQLRFSLEPVAAFPPMSDTDRAVRMLRGRVAFSPDGQLLAFGGSLIDAKTGQVLRTGLVGSSDYEFTADGRWLVGADEQRVILREIRRIPVPHSPGGPPN